MLLWASRVLLKFLWEPHFLLALPDVALERETDGDLLLADMGEVKICSASLDWSRNFSSTCHVCVITRKLEGGRGGGCHACLM